MFSHKRDVTLKIISVVVLKKEIQRLIAVYFVYRKYV